MGEREGSGEGRREGPGADALDPRRAAVVDVAAALAAAPGSDALGPALARAARRADPVAVEEAILQAYLFVGFPAVLEAMSAWRELRGSGPAAAADRGDEPPAVRLERGERLCRAVYGTAYGTLRENVRRLHPALDRWMVEEGYGKALSRPGLDAVLRELCSVAALAVTGFERQLHSHLRGALNLGARPAEVEAALERGLELASDPAWRERARRRWAEVRRRAGAG